ncbi:hypothetical protein [Mycolicibacterium goodii]|uniref:hypothetical protein n=1 Tax=Mycolicibacterium goodii TaxID=134601 RepID=UPI00093BC6D5|nr:hypothetical protein [Mycolicibacterium goodii]MBU8812706.1 hypothetical protein [Mycolicibacterium goodii]MBU8833816.1 hypothetical protein [Mycolicibacterium goodii]OKH62312.1 hypothetical protein EB74_17105 [Mycobacterium sp. SWH-M5]ULN45243.1 hypothetical protein MI170_17870 [Mycolicibacterium goodii]
MTTDPDHLKAQVAEVLADLPDLSADGSELVDTDIDLLAAKLEQAHDVLVQALETVDKGQVGGPQASGE